MLSYSTHVLNRSLSEHDERRRKMAGEILPNVFAPDVNANDFLKTAHAYHGAHSDQTLSAFVEQLNIL